MSDATSSSGEKPNLVSQANIPGQTPSQETTLQPKKRQRSSDSSDGQKKSSNFLKAESQKLRKISKENELDEKGSEKSSAKSVEGGNRAKES